MLGPADTLTLPLPVTAPTWLRFGSFMRVYTAALSVDLLGDCIVTQAWSSRDFNRGDGKTVLVESEEKGLALLHAIAKRRRQRGYQLQGRRTEMREEGLLRIIQWRTVCSIIDSCTTILQLL